MRGGIEFTRLSRPMSGKAYGSLGIARLRLSRPMSGKAYGSLGIARLRLSRPMSGKALPFRQFSKIKEAAPPNHLRHSILSISMPSGSFSSGRLFQILELE